MAGAFKASAEVLLAAEKDSVSHRELPTCFLLRHATELFLKSAIVVAHRAFVGTGADYPAVLVGGKSRPMTNVHGVGALYAALVGILTEHETELKKRARTAWLPMPDELDKAIGEIEAMDERGVFFRYPTERNEAKSVNKPMTAEELAGWDGDQRGPLKALVMVNNDDEIVQAYRYDPNLLTAELAALQVACDWLNSIHVGLRMELAGGR
ncbi:hypothetical protein ACI2KT_34190 [Ensifer adhaerens]|uniref:hypothetical protein n=1 Tax=Ensifer adhaerens TaxID=106592 RepID=UPI00384E7B2D